MGGSDATSSGILRGLLRSIGPWIQRESEISLGPLGCPGHFKEEDSGSQMQG